MQQFTTERPTFANDHLFQQLLAHALLEGETLDEDDAYAAVGVDRGTAPAAVDATVARGEAASTSGPDSPAAPGPGLPWANR